MVESWLRHWLLEQHAGEAELKAKMQYSLMAPCKRFRPVLFLTTLEGLGQPAIHGRAGALALECIHTYSLVHDDLPCMDDDDLRRGQLSSHKKFGEAQAVLAGDALLTLAFELLGEDRCVPAAAMVAELAQCAGMAGMVGGQLQDLRAEKEGGDLERLQSIHRSKTGALMGASLALAGWRAHQDPKVVEDLRRFGVLLGLIFQVRDDILDVTSSEAELGKSIGKDEDQGKLTYPSLMGLDGAQRELNDRVMEAKDLLVGLPLIQDELLAVLKFLAERKS